MQTTWSIIAGTFSLTLLAAIFVVVWNVALLAFREYRTRAGAMIRSAGIACLVSLVGVLLASFASGPRSRTGADSSRVEVETGASWLLAILAVTAYGIWSRRHLPQVVTVPWPSFVLEGNGSYGFDLVGESRFQEALDYICRGRTPEGHRVEVDLVLMEDPFNQFDPDAIQASIGGEAVGYIPRDQTALFKRAFAAAGAKGKAVQVDALIVGGWDRGTRGAGNYGVKLDAPLPLRIRKV